jgi:hypothetical protein
MFLNSIRLYVFIKGRMMEKKAQGLSINAVILIILGLAVLAVLILGFMMGWSKLVPWFGEKNNVDAIAKSCETACNSENLYSYCSVGRKINDGTKTYEGITCYTLATVVEKFSAYGIKSCSDLDCKSVVKCDEWSYTDSSKAEDKGKVLVKNDFSIYAGQEYCKIV